MKRLILQSLRKLLWDVSVYQPQRIRKNFFIPKSKEKKKKKRNQLQFSKREPNAMELREYEIPGIAQSMVLSALILLLAKNSKKLSNWLSYEAIKEQQPHGA